MNRGLTYGLCLRTQSDANLSPRGRRPKPIGWHLDEKAYSASDRGEHTLVLEPLDMIAVPRGENRSFRNISNELGRLLVMIVPETDEQVDPVSYAPSLAKEIENEYGKTALAGLQKIGFRFEDESSS